MLVLSLLDQTTLMMAHPHLNLRVSLPRVCRLLLSPLTCSRSTCSCCSGGAWLSVHAKLASMTEPAHCFGSDLSPVML